MIINHTTDVNNGNPYWKCCRFPDVNCACPKKILGACLLDAAARMPNRLLRCRVCGIDTDSHLQGLCPRCQPPTQPGCSCSGTLLFD